MVALISMDTDLRKLPSEELKRAFREKIDSRPFKEKPTVTLGDMHGNALNFAHKLIALGVLKLPENDPEACYQSLVDAYGSLVKASRMRAPKEPILHEEGGLNSSGNKERWERYEKNLIEHHKKRHETIASSIEKFLVALKRMSCHPVVVLDLIGDLVADRGANDLLTFYLLKKLKESGVVYIINISNHDIGFIYQYERYLETGEKPQALLSIGDQMISSDVLFDYMENDSSGQIKKEVKELYETVYSNHLVLVGVQYNDPNKSLTITAHAPITMMTVFAAADYYEITPKLIENAMESCTGFIKMVNAINAKFQADVKAGKVTQDGKPLDNGVIAGLPIHQRCYGDPSIRSSVRDAQGQMVWNRYISLEEKKEHTNLLEVLREKWGVKQIDFTHGHTGPGKGPGDGEPYPYPEGLHSASHCNIDSNLGKYWEDKYKSGDCRVTFSGPLVTPPQLAVEPKEFVSQRKLPGKTYHVRIKPHLENPGEAGSQSLELSSVNQKESPELVQSKEGQVTKDSFGRKEESLSFFSSVRLTPKKQTSPSAGPS